MGAFLGRTHMLVKSMLCANVLMFYAIEYGLLRFSSVTPLRLLRSVTLFTDSNEINELRGTKRNDRNEKRNDPIKITLITAILYCRNSVMGVMP